MPTKTFAFTPAQVKLIRLLCELDHGALGLSPAQSRTADSIVAYLRGNERAEKHSTEPGTPIQTVSAADILAKLKR